VTALAFAADGKTLMSGSADTTVLIWDLHRFAARTDYPSEKLNANARWKSLIEDDAIRAFDAFHAFTAAPAEAVAFIQENIRPETLDTTSIERWIADLDSELFSERKHANIELQRAGQSALPLLRRAIENDPSPEARKRIEELLSKAERVAVGGETLRSLRAIEILETIATPEARKVLQKLVKGTSGAVVTEAAEEALDRLGR
jgi:hypothetical protein